MTTDEIGSCKSDLVYLYAIKGWHEQDQMRPNITHLEYQELMTRFNPIDPTPEPTGEMVAFYERRTREHIDRVCCCLTALTELPGYSQGILSRGEIHDASKFVPPERVPYIWLTEFHRRRLNGETFVYPDGIEEQINAAIQHHFTTNRHHPEFHASPDEMSDVDLIEMVCDWTAIAQELRGERCSPRKWADENIGTEKRFNFCEAKKRFIYQVIDDVERQLGLSTDC